MEANNGEASGSSSKGQSRIQDGHNVLFRLPSGELKSMKITGNATISFGKYGSFNSSELVGQPYGLTYEVVDKKLKALPPKAMDELEETEATNELIDDGLIVQPLSTAEIEALKSSGVPASEIIKQQIESHTNFALKTEYSKEKYKKRKEAKYAKKFSTIEPTVFNVCEYWFNKDKGRIHDIRSDTLAQMMNLANIRPGGKYLAVDDASGLIASSILARMDGHGRLLTICDVDSPPAYPILVHMNFDEDMINSTLASLNWATAEEDYVPSTISSLSSVVPPTEPQDGIIRSERQKQRLNKRKNIQGTLAATREELFAGEFDSLIIASDYEPYSILERLAPYLSGSGSIVIHSPSIEVLSDVQAKLRADPQYLGPSITEGWLRRYQVLPGRTHPLMMVTGSGGYILHAIKVFDDPSANSVLAVKQKNKKPKVDNDEDAKMEGSSEPPAGETKAE
ncbi:Gcd10p-domain-containing protein [Schizopora paradoxa]|uniref:tRNA (adenine(58)-N(1))-methyltransferase non-catalytic subunit TRM6 n=1 Tax=Schizopora paradoxa TaxID=27342 RepID=A0A0H2SDJ7_9AGAM|nr:Gcd10p-domain-containing protein [Schizopora paradoxa]